MGDSRLRRVRVALGARSRKEKAVGVATLALLASAPFGGLDRAPEPAPAPLAAGDAVRIGPYDVTFRRAYRVSEYVGSQVPIWSAAPVKPSSAARRLLILEADVVNGGKRPEYAQTLTKAVSISGAAAVKGWGGLSTKPTLIYRGDGSAASVLNPGLTHRVALVVEQPKRAASAQATVRVSKVIYVGKGGLASNLDEDYWLVMDETARRGTVPVRRVRSAQR